MSKIASKLEAISVTKVLQISKKKKKHFSFEKNILYCNINNIKVFISNLTELTHLLKTPIKEMTASGQTSTRLNASATELLGPIPKTKFQIESRSN